jgi:radical SAM superfamily enzyme YgiQ (UPF0313 family)
MYRSVQFTTENLNQIEKDIQELKVTYGSIKRIFLLNGDAFVLSTNRLKSISDLLLQYFPKLETITMFGSVRNIINKTDDELKILKKAKINELYIGIETGHPEVLASMNKGYTIDDVYEQMPRLTKAGISFYAAMMLGSGGKGKALEVATETAKLLNHIKPIAAGYTTIGLFEGSELAENAKKGLFTPASEKEIIEELIHVIELVKVDGIRIENEHRLNAIRTKGTLPLDKNRMLTDLHNALNHANNEFLNSSINRTSL